MLLTATNFETRGVDKRFITEEELLHDAYRLGAAVYQSGFRPSFIVGLWRGGSTVGIAVQECLQYLGVETDHISIRTSYRGMEHYRQMVAAESPPIRVHGTQYLLEHLNAEDRLLVVDDVYGTGRNVDAVIRRLEQRSAFLRQNNKLRAFVMRVWCKFQNTLTRKLIDNALNALSVNPHHSCMPGNRFRVFGIGNRAKNLPARTCQAKFSDQPVTCELQPAVQPKNIQN